MSCPHCVCANCDALADLCDALADLFPPAPLEAEVEVVLWRQVDRAVERSQVTRAAEAVGHFVRRGLPGPSRYAIPSAVRS